MFAEKLKQRRLELGLTQEELGASIDEELSRQAISKWERGDNLPEVEKLLILAVKLNISLDELLADELAYIRKDKPAGDDFKNRYPGLIAGLNAFAEALKKKELNLQRRRSHHGGKAIVKRYRGCSVYRTHSQC